MNWVSMNDFIKSPKSARCLDRLTFKHPISLTFSQLSAVLAPGMKAAPSSQDVLME